MAELLYPDVFVGKSLEDVISSPSLWAKCIDMAIQEGDDSLYFLRIQLQNTPGPVARARECQVLLALNDLQQAAEVIEGETHVLCRAMHLSVELGKFSLSACLYITQQPEILTTDRSDLGLESQMRWAFRRAQSFKQIGNNVEALRLFYLTHHTAHMLGVHSIFRVCETQIQSLTPSSFESKINLLSLQCQEAQQANDIRARDYILYNLGALHVLEDDYANLRKSALDLSIPFVRDHLLLVADFFSGNKPSVPLRFLGDFRANAFCVTGYLLWKFKEYKWHAYAFKDRRNLKHKLSPVLNLEIPESVEFPILNFMSWTVRSLACIEAKDTEGAKKALSQMQRLQGFTENMPKWSEQYTRLIEAMLLYHEGREITSHLRESIIKGLDKMKSFRNFVVEFCPELVFFLNEKEPNVVLEDILSRVLLIAKKGCYLGKNLIKGFPQTEVLAEGIDAWYGKGTMTAHHYKLMSRYAEYLEDVDCKSVVVMWKAGGSEA